MSSAELFTQPNPYALAAIVSASESRTIVALRDIVDERGIKLWARDQPVSASLQQRLLQRKLKQPLEACLTTQDGVTAQGLRKALDAFVRSDHALAGAVMPWAAALIEEVDRLPLHGVVQLLLTTVQATKPSVFDHAIRAMALAGAAMAGTGAGSHELRLALLGGLLHDLGEMYIHPQYLDTSQPLDTEGFRHLAVHPRTGALLLSELTDYPPALSRAIGEHHERLDGSGYPARVNSDKFSDLGRLLAVVETTVGIASASSAPWARASFALRVVPGEYDLRWAGFISAHAQTANEDLSHASRLADEQVLEQLSLTDAKLVAARQQAAKLIEQSGPATVRGMAEHAARLLDRLRAGWNAMGLWSAADAQAHIGSRFELEMAQQELRYRLRLVRRECLLTINTTLNTSDNQRLAPLWGCLLDTNALA